MRRDHPNRPIVFVCHSLGGIVCKQALVEAHNADDVHGQLLVCTKGIAFFGTPHRGGHGARLGDSIVRVLHAITGNVRNDILEWLRTDSFLSNHLAENFARRARNMRVVSFMENLPISKHFGLVVPPSSSSLNWHEPAETRVLMEATHTTICKFSSPDDDLYVRVADHMLELLVWAAERPEFAIPTVSISGEPPNTLPPPYTLELTSSRNSLMHSKSQEVLGDFPLKNGNDKEDLPVGWLSRVRAASPFRVPSPRPAHRSRASSSSDEIMPLEKEPPVWPIVMTPYPRNPYYIYRTEIWNQMLSMMNKGFPLILHGVGGCGKTQVAIHLTNWFRDKNPDGSIMWINATSPDTALAGLGLVASRMTIKNTKGEEQRLLTLKDRLEHPNSGRWLMVFDAADGLATYEAVAGVLPSCVTGQVLFTSRRNLATQNPAMQDYAFDLSKMSAFEGANLVHMTMQENLLVSIDPPDMDRLLRKLDYLALAIAQSVAFMNKSAMSLKLYLAKISDETLLAEQLSQNSISEDYISGMAPAVYSTFKLSFERLASEQPEALHLLGCLSFLENTALPIDLVNLLISGGVLDDQPVTELGSYSFIQWSEGNTSLSMKRLLQVAMQKWLQETDRSEEFKVFTLDITSNNFPDAALSKLWTRCEIWLPHALKIMNTYQEVVAVSSIENIAQHHRAVAQLKAKVGLYFHKIGQWSSAQEYLQEALQISRQNFGTMDELTLTTQAMLIETSRYLGKIKMACENARDLKRSRKAKLGRRDIATLESYRLYSLTLQDLGKWNDSMRVSEKGLKGYRDLFKSDPTNPGVLRLCRRTSSSYRMLGQYARTEALIREAIDGYTFRGEGSSEPALGCLYSLGQLQSHMKRFQELEVTSRECLRLRKKLMKPSHPDVLKCVWLVGISLKGQHNWNEAEDLFTEVLEQARSMPGIGKGHMYTLQVLYSLGSLEEERSIEDEAMLGEGAGRDGLHKAKAIFEEVLAGRIEAFGLDHLETLTVKARLAGVHFALGDVDGSEAEAHQVLKVVTNKEYRRLGVASASISWICLSMLTRATFAKSRKLEGVPGKEEELKELQRLAMSYAKQTVDSMNSMIGRQHPDTLDAARLWTEILHTAGDIKTATKVAQRFGTAAAGADDFTDVAYLGLSGP
jgi:tetratricopeptide (TPR) repeat protein